MNRHRSASKYGHEIVSTCVDVRTLYIHVYIFDHAYVYTHVWIYVCKCTSLDVFLEMCICGVLITFSSASSTLASNWPTRVPYLEAFVQTKADAGVCACLHTYLYAYLRVCVLAVHVDCKWVFASVFPIGAFAAIPHLHAHACACVCACVRACV